MGFRLAEATNACRIRRIRREGGRLRRLALFLAGVLLTELWRWVDDDCAVMRDNGSNPHVHATATSSTQEKERRCNVTTSLF